MPVLVEDLTGYGLRNQRRTWSADRCRNLNPSSKNSEGFFCAAKGKFALNLRENIKTCNSMKAIPGITFEKNKKTKRRYVCVDLEQHGEVTKIEIAESSADTGKKEYEQLKDAFLNHSKRSMAQQINKYLS
jgi:hypothetical protein